MIVRTVALLLVMIVWPNVGSSLPSDSQQPIKIVADRAELDEGTGVATYIGNVRMDQGSMRVTANRMIIHTQDERVTKVRAEGELAHYQQQPNPGEPLVRADAQVITYFLDDERVRLEGQALLVQKGDRFSGGEINYDVRAGQVDAQGGRVNMTLEARSENNRR